MTNRQSLISDSHRPLYHFLPPANWMNDPNGLIQWRGQYHLFHQYNPFEPVWGYMHWGHAVSDDLVHWRDLPLALTPEPGSDRHDGCWTGCAVNNGGIPTMVYTEVQGKKEMVFLATSRDDLHSLQKDQRNPVIAAPPSELNSPGFRDPFVWREEEEWKMVIGAGVAGVGGVVLLYRSPDLYQWEYLGPLFSGTAELGAMWECPNFFPLDDHWLSNSKFVLIISTFPRVVYFVGDYDGRRFTPTRQGELDGGGHLYAPLTFLDDLRRRILFGWLLEGRSESAQHAAGWAGVMSLPRIISLGSDGGLEFEPVPEIERLRGEHSGFDPMTLNSREATIPVIGNCLEIKAVYEPGQGKCGLKLCCSPDSAEQTVIGYDSQTQQLYCDRERSSLSQEVKRDLFQLPLQLEAGESLNLHIFLDRSVVEVSANERICLTSRIYPERIDSLGVRVFAEGGEARLKAMEAWRMKAIWPG